MKDSMTYFLKVSTPAAPLYLPINFMNSPVLISRKKIISLAGWNEYLLNLYLESGTMQGTVAVRKDGGCSRWLWFFPLGSPSLLNTSLLSCHINVGLGISLELMWPSHDSLLVSVARSTELEVEKCYQYS